MSYQPTHEENELSFEALNSASNHGEFLKALIGNIDKEIEQFKPGRCIFMSIPEEGSFLVGFKEDGWEFVPDAKLSSCENSSGALIWKGPGHPILTNVVDALHRHLRNSTAIG